MGKGGNLTSVSNSSVSSVSNVNNSNKTSSKSRTNFFESKTGEPHALRRRQILKAHPEIELLYGPDWRPAPVAVLMIISQLVLSYYSQFLSWPLYLLLSLIHI